MIQLVFAHRGYEFGSKDGMPWKHISKDFQNFKLRTESTTLLMGAKTFASLPAILKGRKHIVVCDLNRPLPITKSGESAHQYIDEFKFRDILKDHQHTDKVFSVIGGKHILEGSLPFASRVIKTSIKVGHFDAKAPTQWLNSRFLNDIESMDIVESNFYDIDPTTEITETIYSK